MLASAILEWHHFKLRKYRQHAMQPHSNADISSQAYTSSITLLALLTLIHEPILGVLNHFINLTYLALITVVVYKIKSAHNFR
jgi:hypothetical protein